MAFRDSIRKYFYHASVCRPVSVVFAHVQCNVRKTQAFRAGGENEDEFLMHFLGYGTKTRIFSARAFGARVTFIYF